MARWYAQIRRVAGLACRASSISASLWATRTRPGNRVADRASLGVVIMTLTGSSSVKPARVSCPARPGAAWCRWIRHSTG
ncbi:hypothetical protein C8D88_115178 [Lentzea atacamensis]|uniref:Uncharacterized protein n=1 Tax=Lentzea atacamensis TaxID=531938 RepID=A0A316HQ05_9PSEU|nr:hypothetical protein C8D88_115178 [Lentzea atacamensis]